MSFYNDYKDIPSPYTYKLVKKGTWLSPVNRYQIFYDESPVYEYSCDETEIVAFTKVLNSVYRIGAVDQLSRSCTTQLFHNHNISGAKE